jgi:hypothetical protein
MKPKPRITTAAQIYAARRANEMILPAERSRELCAASCFAAVGGDPSMCDGAACWAQAVAASARATSAAAGSASRRLQRTPAPRPRSIHDVIRDHYRGRD